ANAAIFHMRDWALGTPDGDWVSMGVYSDGSYGIEKGLIYSFPCVCKNGDWEIVQGLSINEFSRGKMQATEKELQEERDAVKELLPASLLFVLKKPPHAVAFLFVGVGLCFGDRSGGVCGRWWVSDYASLIRLMANPTYG